jgi:hypothetical protein
MSTVTGRLVSSIGAGSTVLAVAVQPGLLVPVLLAFAVLCGLPLLLITTLALVAVYSPEPARRTAATKILDRLLATLRPREPVKRPRQRQRARGS